MLSNIIKELNSTSEFLAVFYVLMFIVALEIISNTTIDVLKAILKHRRMRLYKKGLRPSIGEILPPKSINVPYGVPVKRLMFWVGFTLLVMLILTVMILLPNQDFIKSIFNQ